MFNMIRLGLIVCILGVAAAVKITNLSIPSTYILDRNNTAPLKLDCVYDMDEKEQGFVLKWYLDTSQIYQWIPSAEINRLPVAMQSFKNRVDLNHVASPDSFQKHRALVITQPQFNFSGEYTCQIQTYQTNDKKSGRLQIIVPETDFQLSYMINEEDIVIVKCLANDISPEPNLTIWLNGANVSETEVQMHKDAEDGLYDASVIYKIERSKLEEPTPISCVLTIPNTDYTVKREINYNENKMTATTESDVAEIAIAKSRLEADDTKDDKVGSSSNQIKAFSMMPTLLLVLVSACLAHL